MMYHSRLKASIFGEYSSPSAAAVSSGILVGSVASISAVFLYAWILDIYANRVVQAFFFFVQAKLESRVLRKAPPDFWFVGLRMMTIFFCFRCYGTYKHIASHLVVMLMSDEL
jgi:hypothetical protein